MNKQDRQRGYTLAEVLVALAIFAIIFLAALTAYDRSNRVFRTGVESSNMQQNTRVAFDKLVGDLRMAGYDFDRDGIPTGSVGGTNEYQQPDEQFEYIGPGAITIRGNFDYEAENQPCGGAVTDNCDNGVEKTYETTQFPVVTTGNDEIVTYALVPDSQTAVPATCGANDCIQFYADTHVPRRSYPDVPNGGLDEDLVQIKGVDPCLNGCNNPPYTLYRFTLDRSAHFTGLASDVTRTPLASNIRSMRFTYYQDGQGTDPLKDLNNVTDVSTGATILGQGQYRVSNPLALVAERDIRGKINSVRVTLIGMNESRDAAYTDTAETVTGGPGYFEQYRKYRLETLVSPRNIQKRGMREQDTFPPGPATNLVICTGACAGVYLSWTAPAVNNVQGAPDQYKVIYDLNTSPGFNCETTTFTNTFSHVFYQPSMPVSCKFDPTQVYKFAVVALNSYGSRTSAPVTAQPLNNTKPEAPNLLSATTTLNGKVTLSWKKPQNNIPPNAGYSCGPQAPPNPAELLGYKVERESPSGSGNWVPLVPPGGQVTTNSPYDTVTWSDTTAENCVDYKYRVTAIESCYFNPAWNTGSNASLGISPTSNEVAGNAMTSNPPETPSSFLVDTDPVNSPCAGGICQVHIHFRPSIKDVPPVPPPNPITITQYTIYRRQVGVTPFAPLPNAVTGTPPTITNAVVNASGEVEYIDPNIDINTGQVYEYYIVAHSRCPVPAGTDSANFVPARPFPCPFPVNVVSSPLVTSNSFDGDGSLANPYKFDTNANAIVNVLNNAAIVPSGHVTGRNYLGATQQWQTTCPAAPCVYSPIPGPPLQPYYTFAWTMTPNSTERLDVVVVENGGCVAQGFAYFQDEPQNCCLWPERAGILPGGPPANPPVVGFSSGQDTVDIHLQNICSQPLTITGFDFTFSGANVTNQTKIDTIFVPTTGGGGCGQGGLGPNCTSIPFTPNLASNASYSVPGAAALPANILPVSVGATRYTIRVLFTRSINNPNQPITAFTVHYTNAQTPGGTACPVVP